MSSADNIRPEQFLTLDQVRERVTLSKQEIYRRIRRGEFPRQVKLGLSRVAWIESEIEEWIRQQIDASRTHL